MSRSAETSTSVGERAAMPVAAMLGKTFSFDCPAMLMPGSDSSALFFLPGAQRSTAMPVTSSSLQRAPATKTSPFGSVSNVSARTSVVQKL
jgi:hypothetical protein